MTSLPELLVISSSYPRPKESLAHLWVMVIMMAMVVIMTMLTLMPMIMVMVELMVMLYLWGK